MFNKEIDELRKTLGWLGSPESYEIYHTNNAQWEAKMWYEEQIDDLLGQGYYGSLEAKYITA